MFANIEAADVFGIKKTLDSSRYIGLVHCTSIYQSKPVKETLAASEFHFVEEPIKYSWTKNISKNNLKKYL